jgi:hypothetical protein
LAGAVRNKRITCWLTTTAKLVSSNIWQAGERKINFVTPGAEQDSSARARAVDRAYQIAPFAARSQVLRLMSLLLSFGRIAKNFAELSQMFKLDSHGLALLCEKVDYPKWWKPSAMGGRK